MKDERLYMTFPNDMPRHPKITRLSVEARWAFVEMNGEARIADNDGVFTESEAEFMWPREVLAELVSSHPERPLVVHDGGEYRLREFAKHQQTRAEREALRADRAEAGRKGGLAASRARAERALTKSQASANQAPSGSRAGGQQTQAQSESEIPLTDVTYETLSVTEVDVRARDADEDVVSRLREKALIEAERLRITNLPDVREWLEKASGLVLTLGEAVELAGDIIRRAKGDVQDGDRYVIGTCRKSPARVAQYADALDLGHSTGVVA